MITHPRAEELTQAVSRWIDAVRPGLDPRNAFLARVAVNILGVVARQQQLGPAAEAAAVERFTALLGHRGDFASLNREVCERLKAGQMDVATPGLIAALKANVLEQLAIDQPNYRHEGLAGGAP